MIILFVIGLLLGAVSVVFALQNISVITVSFFSWQITGSLSMVLLLAFASGVLVTVFMLMPEFISNYFTNRKLKKENERLDMELRKQKELTHFAKTTPPSTGDIEKIEDGAIQENNI